MHPNPMASGTAPAPAWGLTADFSSTSGMFPREPSPRDRVVQPLTPDQLRSLDRDADAFVQTEAGQDLVKAMVEDLQRLIRFAQEANEGRTARELRIFATRLPVERRQPIDFWINLLGDGRHHLARVVDGIEDERIPLDQRRVVLSNLSGALSECGERVRVELQDADRALSAYRGDLRASVQRMVEVSRDDVIRRVDADPTLTLRGPSSIDTHRLVHLQQALRQSAGQGASRALPATEFERAVARCQQTIQEQVTPMAIAQRLAEECVHGIRADLLQRMRGPLDLSGTSTHRRLLESLVAERTATYGPVKAVSLIELNRDACPELTQDATLVARDIRRGMADLGLAPPPDERPVLTIGQADTCLTVHVMDDHLCHVQAGDPGLEERHPLQREHLERILSEAPPRWTADAHGPADWPPAFTSALLNTAIDRMDEDAMQGVSPDWMRDAETARRFSDRLSDQALAKWLSTCGSHPLSPVGARALLAIMAHRTDPLAATQQLLERAPAIAGDLWRHVGSDLLLTALTPGRQPLVQLAPTVGAEPLVRASLCMLGGAIPQMPPHERLAALTLPAVANRASALNNGLITAYLELLTSLCEQSLLMPSEVGALLNTRSAVSHGLERGMAGGAPLTTWLDRLAQLCERGHLRESDLIALMNTPPAGSAQIALPLRALRQNREADLKAVTAWALSCAGQQLSHETAGRLMASALTPAQITEVTAPCIKADLARPLMIYLDGLRQAHQHRLIDDGAMMQLLHADDSAPGASGLPLLAASLQAPDTQVAQSVLGWLRTLTESGQLSRAELLSQLRGARAPDGGVIGAAIAADLVPVTKQCMALLDVALSAGLLGADDVAELLRRAINDKQSAAVSTTPARPVDSLGLHLRTHPRGPQPHALDVLWASMLPMLASRRFPASHVADLVTQRVPGETPPAATEPSTILRAAYLRLADVVLKARALPATSVAASASTPALQDDMAMTLLECRSGPNGRPLLGVALQGAPEGVDALMTMTAQAWRRGALRLPELIELWRAEDRDGLPGLLVAMESGNPTTLAVYLRHLWTVFGIQDTSNPSSEAPARSPELQQGLKALLGATSASGETATQRALAKSQDATLATYLKQVLRAGLTDALDGATVMHLLSSGTTSTAPGSGAWSIGSAACMDLIDDMQRLALLGGLLPLEGETAATRLSEAAAAALDIDLRD
ncbi:hypothetical protein [Roseateles amylovorans]|uniref:DUF1631 family protein n=1 Tax=Roseateles amylovorans TaxID=2978473 RepID=A0ABY6AU38_9BURK|nr:hypothetical protein [Roseateles amylovorans]UXH76300.1 hypothetical protein N4261_14635 [Roseateles amylovorans]